MDYRNLVRVLVFNKALRASNKHSELPLKGSEVFLLLAVGLLAGVRGVSSVAVGNYLAKFGRSIDQRVLFKLLNLFEAEGLVQKTNRLYSLTISGVNLLKDIEKRCRDTRWDK